ncbi:MAG: hypothetical protein KDJ52_29760, partial [Anaerolineae bacterium]|nr:hypothetical protein [Anaerolineae bacterium]
DDVKTQTLGRIIDVFAAAPKFELDAVMEIVDLSELIEGYRAAVAARELAYASSYYVSYLATPLFLLSANYVIIELLSPLFPEGLSKLPTHINSAITITNELAMALSNIGENQAALALYSLILDPEVTSSAGDIRTFIGNYSFSLLSLNRLPEAELGFLLAKEVSSGNDTSWAYSHLMNFYILTGQLDTASEYYRLTLETGPPSTQILEWRGRNALRLCSLKYQNNTISEEDFDNSWDQVVSSKEVRYISRYLYLWASYLADNGKLDKAAEKISIAVTEVQKVGLNSGIYFALLSRIYLLQDAKAKAISTIRSAINQRGMDLAEQAIVFTEAAHIFAELSMRETSLEFLESAYPYVIADGEPYVWRSLLQKLEDVSKKLNIVPRNVASYKSDPAPIPFEQEIRRVFIEGESTLSGKLSKPQKQSPFETSYFEWFQIGTIAFFGVNNDDLRRGLAEKLITLNTLPLGPIVYAKMGEEVPEPTHLEIIAEQQRYDEIEWVFNEIQSLDKIFVIVFVISKNSKGENVFAYLNIRVDRLKTLLDKQEEREFYDIADYATIVLTGSGDPTSDDRQKLRRDYLFGEHHVNVRSFPPLNEVT